MGINFGGGSFSAVGETVKEYSVKSLVKKLNTFKAVQGPVGARLNEAVGLF
jgi:hypothetical protein